MISIDIGSYSIKLLELKPTKKQGLVLKNIDMEYIDNPCEYSYENVKKAFQKLIRRHKLKFETINVGISDCFLYYQNVENPTCVLDDMEKRIHDNAKKYTPISENDRMISFSIISQKPIEELGKANAHEVLVGVVEKKKIDDLFVLFKSHKLKIANIEASAAAYITLNTFNQADIIEDSCIYLDIGFTSTKITFVRDGIILYSKIIPLAGKYFTSVIADKQNISFEQAEKWKKEQGNVILDSSLKSALLNWEKEIKKSIEEFNGLFEKKFKIKMIFLAGGNSKIKKLDDYLNQVFSCIVIKMETFTRIPFDSQKIDKEFVEKNGYLFFNCIGMSLREAFRPKMTLNLLPRDIRVSRILFRRYAYIVFFVLIIFSGVLVNVVFNPFLKKKKIDKENIISNEQYEKEFGFIKNILLYEKNYNKKINLNNILTLMSDTIPEGMFFTDISINRDENNKKSVLLLELKGETKDKLLLESFIKKYTQYIKDSIKDINIDITSKIEIEHNKFILKYVIKSENI
ncbi:pilus assembly protein PilM [Candidatus Poribacteria bacterium]|nr:pilus assembly protein PilM [Candidatus Poribacteria bacterium]